METPGENTTHASWMAEANKSVVRGRLVQTDEMARAVAYLASAESGLMTGAIIDFDQAIQGCFEAHPQPIIGAHGS
jgi:NAD(P)-dependent dehydrogenase (short-subunit alcohol dehydrogenase family)